MLPPRPRLPRRSFRAKAGPRSSSSLRRTDYPHDLEKTILKVSNLRVERGGTVILDGISWRVLPGEHWVILGANGSGKTSLLSVLTGYLTPSSGRISVLNRDYGRSDWRELRKEIGLVSSSIRQLMANDEPAVETVISGKYAMIDFWGKASSEDHRQARKILREIECEYLAERPWLVLSQGERQRVLIGRALMAKPRLLILDEPCGGLDPAAREQFLSFLHRLGRAKNSPTLVLVTHHVEEIMPGFSHLLILKSGKVLASGKTEDHLTGKMLSEAFETPIRMRKTNGRFSISVSVRRRVVI